MAIECVRVEAGSAVDLWFMEREIGRKPVIRWSAPPTECQRREALLDVTEVVATFKIRCARVRYAGSSGSTAFGHPPRGQGVRPGLCASGYELTLRANMATGLKESRDR